jgi:hypothetical protein
MQCTVAVRAGAVRGRFEGTRETLRQVPGSGGAGARREDRELSRSQPSDDVGAPRRRLQRAHAEAHLIGAVGSGIECQDDAGERAVLAVGQGSELAGAPRQAMAVVQTGNGIEQPIGPRPLGVAPGVN